MVGPTVKCRCPLCQTVASVPFDFAGKYIFCGKCQCVFQALPSKDDPKEMTRHEASNDPPLPIYEPPPVEDWIKELNREPKAEPPIVPNGQQAQATKGCLGCLVCIALVVFISCSSMLGLFNDNGGNNKDAAVTEVTLTPQEIEAERLYGKKPTNSAWDASVAEVEKYLRDTLHDPDPQFSEWSQVVLVQDNGWVVRCKYRARNQLGGYVLKEEFFVIRNGTVISVRDWR